MHHNNPKFLGRYPKAKSVDPDQTADIEEQSDQGLHCLQFILYLYEAFFYGKVLCWNFSLITANFDGVRKLTVLSLVSLFLLSQTSLVNLICSKLWTIWLKQGLRVRQKIV